MDWMAFGVFLAAAFAAASTGSMFSPDRWYEELDKPAWTPPNWLFPVAWTILYIAMAVAAARVATKPDPGLALAFWALQITLNTLWSPIFFGLNRIGASVVVMACMWVAVTATTVMFYQLDTIAGALFVPYFIWTSYAAALNVSVWRRNPSTMEPAARPTE